MSELANGSFETVGASPGDAAAWTVNVQAATRFASFVRADGGYSRFESFEAGWNADAFVGALTPGVTSAVGMFASLGGATPYDGFESEWANSPFYFTLEVSVSCDFADGTTLEGFEDGWANVPFFTTFAQVSSEQAAFVGTGNVETFESGWADPYYFTMPTTAAAIFNEGGVTGTAETFESYKTDQVIAVTLPSTIGVANHGFAASDLVTFFEAVDGVSGLPTGLTSRIPYYVVSPSTNAFGVAISPGGSPVVMTDIGKGSNYVRVNMALSWGGRDGDTAGSDP